MNFMESIDTVPCSEEGSKDCFSQRKEARRYINLLKKVLPTPEGCEYRIKFNDHDFGGYISIDLYGDNDNDEHWEWINKMPEWETWEQLETAAYGPKKEDAVDFKILVAKPDRSSTLVVEDIISEFIGKDNVLDTSMMESVENGYKYILTVEVRNYNSADIQALADKMFAKYGDDYQLAHLRADSYKENIKPFVGQTFFIW